MTGPANTCPDCGATRPANAPAGLCPQCLLRLGLGADLSLATQDEYQRGLSATQFRPGDHGLLPPLPEGPHASAPSRVLNEFDESLGPAPRVLLRDGPADDRRPVRPGSEEMPELGGDSSRYQLLGEIARGGIGAILKGRDVDLGRDLAIKVLLEKHRDHPEMVRRFIEEAQIGGQLQHPGIVPVHELGRFPDGRFYIAMKMVAGRTLAALLESRKDPTEDRSRFLAIFEQVCQTLAYAHSRGVIHRDLKPSNVMVGNFGEVQVMDWGLAKVLDQGGVADEERSLRSQDEALAIRTVRTGSDARDSHAGSVLGTPAYMAPEQARGALDTVDERADVFGLGSILCEILTGHPAFTGKTVSELYRKAERADLGDALARLDACDAEPDLVALAKACLAAVPKNRPRDAGVVLADLTAYVASVDQRLRAAELAKVEAEARAVGERKRRVLSLALAASALGTALLGGGAWAWVARDHSRRTAKTAGVVNKAYDEAIFLRSQARTDSGGDLTKWDKAIEAAKRAEALLAEGESNEDLLVRVQGLLTNIAQERAEASLAVKDRHIVEQLAAIHNDLGVHLDSERANAEYAEAFRNYGVDVDKLTPEQAGSKLATSPAATELANALDQWTFLRLAPDHQDVSGARRLVEIAKIADPDPWRNRLRETLNTKGRDRGAALEALERLAETADPDRLPEASVTRLAFALASLGRRKTALSLLRRTQQLHPDGFWINCDLGRELMFSKDFAEAVRFYSNAVAVRPRSSFALNNLGTALHNGGRLEEAIATFQRAIQIQPDNVSARISLGAAWIDQGDIAKAKAVFREAKELKSNECSIHTDIAQIFASRGDWEPAIAELRDGVRHEPDSAVIRECLGAALLETGHKEEAEELFREAVRLEPRHDYARVGLGRALLARGDLDAALRAFHHVNYRNPEKHRPDLSAKLARETERMVALDARLPRLLCGEEKPTNPAETMEAARLCQSKQLDEASAKLWSQAFASEPKLAEDFNSDSLYHAASAAALAGCCEGKDSSKADAKAQERWRQQARSWLRTELASCRKVLERGVTREGSLLRKRLGRWQIDPAFAGIRDETRLAQLSKVEQEDCRALWTEVEALKKQVRTTIPLFNPPPHF